VRVAKLTEVRKIEVVEGEKPEISSEYDVQVKVKAVGICGTDLHIFNEGRADVILPRVMGHELSGEVTAVGTEVGRTFEELAEIISRVERKDHVGVCLDTCHVYDAGYDVVGWLDDVLGEFDRVLGLSRLRAIHSQFSLDLS